MGRCWGNEQRQRGQKPEVRRRIQPGGKHKRNISPNVSSFFDRFVKGSNDVLCPEVELAVLLDPSVQILAERESSHGHVVAIDQVVFEQEVKNFCSEQSLNVSIAMW